ncbi:patatin-like phospholipase family protein [Candidatus Peregrinibacteria bacterium]|nr:MAG: patatin-like phospholipase family protein [Candidatus Peregrinibacteria bacterium]
MAHFGAIKALEEAGIKPDLITGTSIGAMVGAAYASGKIKEMEKFALSVNKRKTFSFMDTTFLKNGLVDGEKIAQYFSEHFFVKNVEDALIPLMLVATELESGREIQISSGTLIDAVRASISIPGIFTTVKMGDMHLVDGGLVNPLPINIARDVGCNVVIAVDLNNEIHNPVKAKEANSDFKNRLVDWFKKEEPNLFEVIANSIKIMEKKITEANLKEYPADILIQPELGHVKLFDFHKTESSIKEGYEKTKEVIPEIKKLMQ